MKIVKNGSHRILVKDDAIIVDISDGHIIQYRGIHYKPKNKDFEIVEEETNFIGKIETQHADGAQITGIYVVPIYVWNNKTFEWFKIINYEPPKNKYFLYPHLLMLPHTRYHYQPLYLLHTCETAHLQNYEKIIKTIDLEYIN
jgi:hypothetical protein